MRHRAGWLRKHLTIAMVVLFAAVARTYSQSPPTYSELVDRLKAGDRTVDLTVLRRAFADTPMYNGMMMAFYQQLWRPLNARDFERATQVAEAVLARDYVEANAHLVAAAAHRELGHTQQAEFHQFVADGLIRSITSKRDGKSAETAYEVIDISEEYALFHAMNVTMKLQGVVGPYVAGQPIVDRIIVVDAAQEEHVIFFSVDNPESVKRKRNEKPQG